MLTGVDYRDRSGESVSVAGYVNGDGIDDLVVAAYSANRYAGESYMVFGSTQAFPALSAT